MSTIINVQSEIGKLNTVIVRRPNLELENLTPDHLPDLLFDDIPFLPIAQKEHDNFAKVLTDQGARVLYLEQLLKESINTDSLKEDFVKTVLSESPHLYGYTLDRLKDYLLNFSTEELVTKVMAGVRKDEVHVVGPKSLMDLSMSYPFYLDPMPNLYFTRDPAAAIANGVVINHMKEPVRRRESLFMQHIIKHHPDFENEQVPIWLDRDCPYSIEGGDILVLSKEVVAIGISARTTAGAIEYIARGLFSGNSGVTKVVAVDIPKKRAFMHLDTVFTMLDYDKFSVHPEIKSEKGDINSYIIEKDGDDLKISLRTNLKKTLEEVLDIDNITLIPCGGGDIIAAPREQWSDGSNTLAVAAGVVIAYDRNPISNKILREYGIEVIEIASGELSRGRGGPRCMSMPINRV